MIDKVVPCRESFASGIGFAAALVIKMGANCISSDDEHHKVFKIISDRIVSESTLAFATGKIKFEKDE